MKHCMIMSASGCISDIEHIFLQYLILVLLFLPLNHFAFKITFHQIPPLETYNKKQYFILGVLLVNRQ